MRRKTKSTKPAAAKVKAKAPVEVKRPVGGQPHEPTAERRRMVEALVGMAMPTVQIAKVLAVSQPTLLKHYAEEIHNGSAKVEAQLIGNLLNITKGKDGTALKAICFALNCRFGWSAYVPRPPGDAPSRALGKKAEADAAAQSAHQDSDWSELIH